APRLARNAAFRTRFVREAYAAAQLVHHNVVQIYDIGTEAGTVFFSMEYVPGDSLSELLRRRGRLEVAEAVGYVFQAARGPKYAHERGRVHRDVKPDTLLLNDQGVIKIADLGLVRCQADAAALDGGPAPGPAQGALTATVTQAQAALGTPAYMAPEQARDAAAVDHRA